MSNFRHDIAGGSGDLIIDALQSQNYVPGVSGWMVAKDGDAEFNSLDVRGVFTGVNWVLNEYGLFFYAAQ